MTTPTINLQELQARIGSRAKSAPTHRFWGIYVHVWKLERLKTSYLVAKGNRGAPGVDGVTFDQVEASGRQQFLEELSEQLRAETYGALPYWKVEVPEGNGKTRTISIAALRDRVAQGAVKLVIEPIFEADFSDTSMGGRPGRRAHQALARVQQRRYRGERSAGNPHATFEAADSSSAAHEPARVMGSSARRRLLSVRQRQKPH